MPEEKKEPRLQSTALAVTRWVGSVQSIIIHTCIFIASFFLAWSGYVSFDRVLLVLTTLVSLEAIYLAIFIQMTINVQQQSLEEVEHDIDEIQGDIDEIQEDVEEMQEDVEEIQEDVDEIAEDVDEIAEDVDELHENVEEMSEEDKAEEAREQAQHKNLQEIRDTLGVLMKDLEKLQKGK